jgi:2-iminobutanoate/2-iminopropanoate deaminase
MARRTNVVASEGPAPSGTYSPAVRVGEWVFVSGQGPTDTSTGLVRGETIEDQTVAVVRNIEAVLAAAGGDLRDIVKVSVFLKDLAMFEAFDRAYRAVMPNPPPARTTVGADVGAILLEVDVIAHLAPSQ